MGFFNITKKEAASLTSDCYTGSVVPNYTIEKVLGTIQFTRKGMDGDVIDKVDDMFENLVKCAKKDGADAVINAKMTTGSYQEGGSGWIVSYITVYGESVILKYNVKD